MADNELKAISQNESLLPNDVATAFSKLRSAARELRGLPTDKKNLVLNQLADRILKDADGLLSANREDLARLPNDTTNAFRDRLLLDDKRITAMAESLREVAKLPDPVNEIVEERVLKSGVKMRRVRAPLGVILMIFESRPNVILEAFSLGFKAGNAIALRGGSDSQSTASILYQLMHEVLTHAHVSRDSFYGFNNYDRAIVSHLLTRNDLIDIVVPRGGEKLIAFVSQNAKMPVIKNDRGLCHAYVAEDADLTMAVNIVDNAKTQRPGVCNSLETVLVNEMIAQKFLPLLFEKTAKVKLRWLCDADSLSILKNRAGFETTVSLASERDWNTEHLDLILNCRIVKNLGEALAHIEKHGSKHSELIITKDETKAREFQNSVDAAAVYWNASTRFTDGFEFGLGGELGISTQKLHVRGPVGLRELTTPRWIGDGTGQIRT